MFQNHSQSASILDPEDLEMLQKVFDQLCERRWVPSEVPDQWLSRNGCVAKGRQLIPRPSRLERYEIAELHREGEYDC